MKTITTITRFVLSLIIATTTIGYVARAQVCNTNFNIILNNIGTDRRFDAVFELAAQRWMCIITSNRQLVIDFSVVPIDGVGRVLGSAGPSQIDRFQGLTTRGTMRFDEADIVNLDNQDLLKGTILHEMGHVLGIGTLWGNRQLALRDCTASSNQNRFTYGFNGNTIISTVAQAMFSALGFPNLLRIEDTGGAGTACGHFDEQLLDRELMTGIVDRNMPISNITIGTLSDLGYEVNFTEAEAFDVNTVNNGPSVDDNRMRFEGCTEGIGEPRVE
eukprot:Pgem_evm1s6308